MAQLKYTILSLLINTGSFTVLAVLRKILFDHLDINIPLTWWTLTPAVIVVVLINIMVDRWIEKGDTIAWRK